MIKLLDILKEEKTFKAKSKETGRIVTYKSKEARDKAIKAGKSEPVDKKKSDKKVKGSDLFTKDKTPVKVGDKKPKVNTKELRKDFKEKTKEYNNPYEMHTALDDDLSDYNDYNNISDKKLRDSIRYEIDKLQDKLYTVSDTDAKFEDLEEIYVELETLKKQVNHILDRQTKPEVGTKVKDGKLKSSGPQQFADDVKNMKGEYDLDGGMKIKDGKMFDADGEEMDSDDIEDFYYQDAFDEKGNNVGIEMGPKKEKSEDEIFKPRDESWFDDFAEKNPKFKAKMDKKYRNKNHTSDDYYKLMLGVEEKIKKIRNKWMKENPGKRIPGTLTSKLGDESEYLMDSAQKMAAHETGNDYADFRWSNKWSIEMDRKHLPNTREVKENEMKLKNLLKEAKVWERKFGEPLPTLDSVMKKHQGNKVNEKKHLEGPLSRQSGINVFGGKQLQLMSKSLRQTAFDLEKVAKKKDEQAFDDILQRITITVGVMRSFLNKPKRRM